VTETRPGVWWTSVDPARRVPGTLVREDGKWRLDLIGNLPVAHGWTSGLSLVPAVTIFGSSLGYRYTIRKAFLAGAKGPTMRFGVPADDRDGGDDQYWQHWSGDQLLKGEALSEDSLFQAATFELTGLGDWWQQSGLQPNAQGDGAGGYTNSQTASIECGDDLTLRIGTIASESHGRRTRSVDERVIFHVASKSGMTFSEIQSRVIAPLRALLAIVLKTKVEYSSCRLELLDNEGYSPYPIDVDPIDDGESKQEVLHWPTFTSDAVDLHAFLPGWLELAHNNDVPLSVAEGVSLGASLAIDVVETVNAAETLHRTLTESQMEYPFAQRVREALKKTGLNSEERRKVFSSVKMSELSLERRLSELVEVLGDSFCSWLFNGQMADWAFVAATVRNALSHGYPTKHGVEQETGALLGILRLTRAVISLRLLCEAGLPSGDELIVCLARDQTYLALLHQDIADWRLLAERIRASQTG
jgi:hypothetical protein